jgi:hypothetical protein
MGVVADGEEPPRGYADHSQFISAGDKVYDVSLVFLYGPDGPTYQVYVSVEMPTVHYQNEFEYRRCGKIPDVMIERDENLND